MSRGRFSTPEFFEPAQEREVVVEVLAESDPGVKADAFRVDAGGPAALQLRFKKRAHLGDHVVVTGRGLHRARCSLHVHENKSRVAAGRDLDHGGIAKPAHVVDDVGPGRTGLLRDGGFQGVDGQERAGLSGGREFFEDGQDSAKLLTFIDRGGSRAGQIPRQCRGCPPRPPRGRGRGRQPSRDQGTIRRRKGVGRDVDNPHDETAPREFELELADFPGTGLELAAGPLIFYGLPLPRGRFNRFPIMETMPLFLFLLVILPLPAGANPFVTERLEGNVWVRSVVHDDGSYTVSKRDLTEKNQVVIERKKSSGVVISRTVLDLPDGAGRHRRGQVYDGMNNLKFVSNFIYDETFAAIERGADPGRLQQGS